MRNPSTGAIYVLGSADIPESNAGGVNCPSAPVRKAGLQLPCGLVSQGASLANGHFFFKSLHIECSVRGTASLVHDLSICKHPYLTVFWCRAACIECLADCFHRHCLQVCRLQLLTSLLIPGKPAFREQIICNIIRTPSTLSSNPLWSEALKSHRRFLLAFGYRRMKVDGDRKLKIIYMVFNRRKSCQLCMMV